MLIQEYIEQLTWQEQLEIADLISDKVEQLLQFTKISMDTLMQVPSEAYAQPLSKEYFREHEFHCMLFTISSLKILYSPMMDIDHYMINQDYKF